MTTTTAIGPGSPLPGPATTAELAPTPPPARGELRAAIASEATKLRSVRSTVWTVIATIGGMIGIGMIISFARVGNWDNLTRLDKLTFDPTNISLRGVHLAQLGLGVLGVLVISSEYAT